MTAQLQAALRALQKLDERISLEDERPLLLEAETQLGNLLGLQCTGSEGEHNGETCPVHEWLVPSDGENLRV